MQRRSRRARMYCIGEACAESWAANELRQAGSCTEGEECERRQWRTVHARECSISAHHRVPSVWPSTFSWSTQGLSGGVGDAIERHTAHAQHYAVPRREG